MFDLLNPLNPRSLVRPALDRWHGPVDATRGSQGAPIAPEGEATAPGGHSLGDFQRGFSQEGIFGLFDMQGMVDRAAAQRELASRFNVIPDDALGTREQNQVTQEEFQRLARTYSDIRLGRSDLTLGDRPANMSEEDYASFRGSAMNDIADILQTESGRGLVDSLANAPLQADGTSRRTTTINPRVDASGNLDASNAEGGGTFGVSGYADYAAGMDHLPSRDNLRSDVTLYHELVHAHHAVHNTWDAGTVDRRLELPFGISIPLPEPDRGIGEFEHQAAGLGRHANDRFSENRYRAERRRIGELGVGARTTGAETDADMTRRTTYSYPGGPRTAPARMPGAPSTVTGASGGPGAGGAVGRSTREDDHDHHHVH
jgi:hypothetical protein